MAAINSDSEDAEGENNERERHQMFQPNSTRANWKRNSVYNQMLEDDFDELEDNDIDTANYAVTANSLRRSDMAFDPALAKLARVNSGNSFERKVMEMETTMRKKRKEVDDDGFTNYTELNLTLLKK